VARQTSPNLQGEIYLLVQRDLQHRIFFNNNGSISMGQKCFGDFPFDRVERASPPKKILGVVEVHMEEELKHGSRFLVADKIIH